MDLSNYFCTNSGSCNPCQPPQPPKPPVPPSRSCPCGEDFRRLLELLCGQQLRSLVDFSSFAFVSDFYVLGTALAATTGGTAPADNLGAPAANYVCGSDNCETVTVSGTLYAPSVGATALEATVTQAALCRLTAIAFGAAGDSDTVAANFQSVSQIFSQLLRTCRPQECGSMGEALTNAAAIRASTVAAGPLIVENSVILGQLGNILVMANSTNNRFYFLCADKIDFIG